VCTYPNGKLAGGMQYETLVSSGFTSPVIAGCILDRNMEGALEVAGHLRQRHDGRHRSPWNEPECGLLYSRAMAHWNIFDQCCGHVYDSHTGSLSFDPRSSTTTSTGDQTFQCFYSVEGGWGSFSQTGPTGLPSGSIVLNGLWGTTRLSSLAVVSSAMKATAMLDGKSIAVEIKSGLITFKGGLTVPKSKTCTITLLSAGVEEDRAVIGVAPATCDGNAMRRRHIPSASLATSSCGPISPPCCASSKADACSGKAGSGSCIGSWLDPYRATGNGGGGTDLLLAGQLCTPHGPATAMTAVRI